MRKRLFHTALTVCFVMVSGLAVAQTCDEIQVYTTAGEPDQSAPYWNTQVTVSGTVVVEPGMFNVGTTYIMDATGGVSFFEAGTGLQVGDEIEVTGTVGQYGSEIQLNGISFSPGTGVPLAPVVMTVPEVLDPTYETIGTFVRTYGKIVSVSGGTGGSSGEFRMIEEPLVVVPPDTLLCYVDSDTGIDLGAMAVDDIYQVDGVVVNFGTIIEIKPRMQADLVENPFGDTVPVIADVDCQNWVPMVNDPITVTATITDDNAITTASVFYRTNDNEGASPGSWMSVAMSNTGGDTYEGTIPGQSSEIVEFYVSATDNAAQTSTNPGDAPTSSYGLFIGLVSIYDMCTVHPDSSSQANVYNGKYVNVQGVITAGTGPQAGALSKFVMQEPDPNPATGDYTFGALLVYEGSAAGTYYRGDLVQVGGTGNEYFGLSQVLPHTPNAINLVSFGNTLPDPMRAPTRILADDEWDVTDGTGNLGEAFESVWVKTFTSQVADTLTYGEYTVCDKYETTWDTLIIGPLQTLAYQPTIGDILTIEGFMDYSYGDRQLVPISDAFIVMSNQTDVGDMPTILPAGGFERDAIKPNPFNPSTKISFVVNRDNLVQLNIYNIRGEKVRTLIQDRLPANSYSFEFDGRDDSGAGLASGTYFARLRIGAEVMQVRKLALLK